MIFLPSDARQRLVRIVTLFITFLVLVPSSPGGVAAQTPVAERTAGGDVPMFRGDAARSGTMPGPGVDGEPAVLWQFETASPQQVSPAIVDGVAYIGDGLLGGGGLRAVDVASGGELWSAEVPGQPLGSSPAVVDGMAYIGDLGGNVSGIDVTTGELVWSVVLGGDITSSPAVVDDTVYIRNGEDVLFALDALTGEERWRFAASGDGGYTLDTALAVVDGMVYVTTLNSEGGDSLYALDAETGEERWSFAPDEPGLHTPAVVDGVVYAGGDGGIYAVDADSGEQIWNAPIGEGFSAPAVTDGLVVIHTRSDMVAVDAASGEQLWRYDTGGSWSAPTVVDGVVYVGSNGVAVRQGLHAVDAASGELLWQVQELGEVNSSPVVTGGVVYVGSSDGLFSIGSSDMAVAISAAAPVAGTLTFASGLDAQGEPVDPGETFPSGVADLYIVYDFSGIPEGATFRTYWMLDGEPLYDGAFAWDRGEKGRASDWISANDGALPDGTYEVVLFVDGVEVERGTATIGG